MNTVPIKDRIQCIQDEIDRINATEYPDKCLEVKVVILNELHKRLRVLKAVNIDMIGMGG